MHRKFGQLVRFRDKGTDCWSLVRLPSGEPVFTCVYPGLGVTVRRSRFYGFRLAAQQHDSQAVLDRRPVEWALCTPCQRQQDRGSAEFLHHTGTEFRVD